MGSGKNTVGDFLEQDHGYKQQSFAFALRMEVQDAIIRNAFPEECPVNNASELGEATNPWDKPTPPLMRALLQWWGTDYRRKADPEHWVRRLLYRLSPVYSYAITDVRYENEAKAIRENGGEVWLVEGRSIDNEGIAGHVSEELGFECDRVISNDSTLEDLREKVKRALARGE